MMREKEKKREEEEEETMLDHFLHEHPLSLSEYSNEIRQCHGCIRDILSGETVYRCHKPHCGTGLILHEECAEMPPEIRVSMHPQHTLVQKKVRYILACEVCGRAIMWMGYSCSSSCDFHIHVGCAPDIDLVRSCIDHPSHPHQLTLQWRPGRSCSTRCHACGTIHKGNTYVCADCQYCLLQSCADLPTTADYHHLHHHSLSLAFRLPLEYIKLNFKCNVCFKGFFPRYWVYLCGICRYVVHVNCAVKSSPATSRNSEADAGGDDEEAITFPVNDAGEELIGPFVKRVGGEVETIPDETTKYKFHNHHHELRLISSSSSSEEEENSSDDDDDDDDLNCSRKSQVICDGCTAPILFQKKQKSCYYMSCGECKYFLHWACFNLPSELPSHPLHRDSGHSLILRTPPKLDLTFCSICFFHTNGLIYKCTKCTFQTDIKCASLPDTIKHAAHARHHLKLLDRKITRDWSYWQRPCGACDNITLCDVCYRCDNCGILLHSSCALLPSTVRNPRWDKHPLPLTYDASADHPSDFYCEVCETEMSPTMWMYHCRSCDVSVHPRCFPTATGYYRNIKFGQRYMVAPVHHHPLVYQLLTTKLHCDVCTQRKEYGCLGFQCASDKCEFFMCSDTCATHHQHQLIEEI